MKRQVVERGGWWCRLQSSGHRAPRYELFLQAERGGDIEIFAATGTNAPPAAQHSRDPLLLAVMELLPFVTLPRTYSPKNRLDLLGAGSIHRPLSITNHIVCVFTWERVTSSFSQLTFTSMSSETADLDFVWYSGCVRRGVHLCGWGVRLLAGLDQHRRSPDAGG